MIGPVPRLTAALAVLLSFVLVGCNGSEETNGKSSEGNGDDGGAGAAPGSHPTDGWHTTNWATPRGGNGLQGRVHDVVIRRPKVEWEVELDGPIVGDAAIADDTIYIGTVMGTFYALDFFTGKERWKFVTEDTIEAPPTVALGKVFIGSCDRFFYCLDQKSGQELWKYEAADKFVGGGLVVRSPDDTEDWVIVNAYDGICRALRVTDGSEAWIYETAEQINGTPAIVDGKTIVLGGCDMVVHSINLADGMGINEVPVDAEIIGTIATMGSMVYSANYANQLVAADVHEENPKWIYEDKDFGFYASPAVNDEMVFVGSRDKHLHAVNRETGVRAWKVKTGSRVDGAAIVFDDAVVFGSGDGRLYALAPKDGSELWRLDLGEGIASDLAFAHGRIVVGGTDGQVFCIVGQ
jgi:outer membrane protein assembly factor BamB